jgi:precorrin-2/cobalt-factor-2 C20-methyltransferase
MSEPQKPGIFYGVGVGPGDPSLLTLKAVDVLRSVDIIFQVAGTNTCKSVSGSVVDSVEGIQGERVELVFTMAPDMAERRKAWQDHAAVIVAALREGKSCAFATIGDPLFYSTYTYLVREMEAIEPELTVKTVPGITSFQAAASRANMPVVEDKETFALIPAWTDASMKDPCLDTADTIVMLKAYRKRNQILETLKEHGMEGRPLYAAKIGLDDELVTDNMDEMRERPEEYLSMLIAKRK